jgi:uncharacterized membrane protein
MSTQNEVKQTNSDGFALSKANYKLLLIGIAIIVVGFVLMAGGASTDPKVFNPEMFNFQRIVLAPVVVVAGFLFIIYGIMKKTK